LRPATDQIAQSRTDKATNTNNKYVEQITPR
jgi:hypothetical protein